MKAKILLLLLVILQAIICTDTAAQNLKRRPFLGVQLSPVTEAVAEANKLKTPEGALVAGVIPNSTAATLKLQPGDVLVQVNKTAVKNPSEVVALARNFKTAEPVSVAVIRKGKKVTAKGNVMPMPFETGGEAEVQYDEVKLGEGAYVRSIIKKPKGKGRFPTVFYIQGFSCSSLDNLPEKDNQRQLIDGLVKKGYVVFRMEKPGVGDSKGTRPCQEIGYNEEVAAFAAGLSKLKEYDFVDAGNIFLFGHSLGGTTAPVIASSDKVKGIITYGAVGKPWMEYMLEVFREQPPIAGADYVEVEQDMKTLLPLAYDFMILKKKPEELVKVPNYKHYLDQNLGYDGQGHVFGRHYSFMQEIQDVAINKAWKDANAYTLAIYGEADLQAIDPEGAQMITDIVNSYYPGKATFHLLPKTDHGFAETGTKKDYSRLMESGKYNAVASDKFNHQLVDLLDAWMKDKLKKA